MAEELFATEDISDGVFLLDSYGLIFREYYAMIKKPLTNTKGENISALFGFFRNIRNVIKVYNPKYFVAAMDSKTKTFRHEMYAEYKANRTKTPDDLHAQVPWICDVLQSLGIKVLQKDGYEADDIIATVAKMCKDANKECRILSGDKDLMQLVGGSVKMLTPVKFGSGGWQECDEAKVKEIWGVNPSQMLDMLTLVGDTADNIPGVKGIGEKTALKLLTEYGSIDNIYAHSSEIEGAVGKKIREDKAGAELSKKLITLCDTVPIEVSSLEDLAVSYDFEAASQKLKFYEVPAIAKLYAKGVTAEIDSSSKNVSNSLANDLFASDSSSEIVENKGEYSAILTKDDLHSYLDKFLATSEKEIAFDTETTSLNTLEAHLIGFSLSYEEGKGVYVPIQQESSIFTSDYISKEDAFKELSRLFSNKDVTVIMHNAKYDYEVLLSNGFQLQPQPQAVSQEPQAVSQKGVQELLFDEANDTSLNESDKTGCADKTGSACACCCTIADSMIAAWLLEPDGVGKSPFALESLAERLLHLKGIEFDDIVEKGASFADVPLEKATDYCAEDSDFTLKIYHILKQKLKENGLYDWFKEVELPLVPLLSEMELSGIHLDSSSLHSYRGELENKIYTIQKEIFELVGHEFNIASTKQLQQVLFEERGLKTGKKTKTGYSTDTAVMEELALVDPVPQKILEYRMASKLLSTYVDALPSLADKNGRVHTTFLQTGTATGRLSSRDPNLQNIPVRNEEGRRIRSAFTAAEGTVLISADYAQIELVVLAHLSGDEELQKAFIEGTDVHKATAALIYGVDSEKVSAEMRRTAKTINFGIIYGMSAFRLAKDLGITRTVAKTFIDSYFTQYPKIQEFIDKTVKEAEKNGYVETLFHRKRYIKNITSGNKIEKNAAERVAVNTPIQGSAADIVKKAMLSVDKALKAEENGAHILLQVHDELIVECPFDEKIVEKTKEIIKREMENAVKLSVPLRVSIESGKSWGEFH